MASLGLVSRLHICIDIQDKNTASMAIGETKVIFISRLFCTFFAYILPTYYTYVQYVMEEYLRNTISNSLTQILTFWNFLYLYIWKISSSSYLCYSDIIGKKQAIFSVYLYGIKYPSSQFFSRTHQVYIHMLVQ